MVYLNCSNWCIEKSKKKKSWFLFVKQALEVIRINDIETNMYEKKYYN